MDKKNLSELDIRTKFITPGIVAAGWDINEQMREDVHFTDGRIHVRGKLHARGAAKKADYILYYKPNLTSPMQKVSVRSIAQENPTRFARNFDS